MCLYIIDSLKQGDWLEGNSGVSKSLRDTLMVAAMCDIDLMSHLLLDLVDRLKTSVRDLQHPLVPEGIYLPAPPFYCPQPVITDEVTNENVFYSSNYFESIPESKYLGLFK